MLHNKFVSLLEEIQKQLDDKIKKIGEQGRDNGD